VIRIEIGNMPSLLGSIVRSALETQEDFVIVDTSKMGTGEAFETIDVVIVAGDRGKMGSVPIAALVREDPPSFVAIAADGNSASIFRVTAEDSRIDAASDLLSVVRRAAMGRRAVH
jgi:hypothetical protein